MTAEVQARALSRRRIVQGAIWAAPAIMIATASPAAAASTVGSITGMNCLVWRSGVSDNFFAELTASVSGVPAGTVMTATGTFDTGGSTATVTDNSSGWSVATLPGAGAPYVFTALRTHDGSGTLAVVKLKIDVAPAAGVLGKPMVITFSVAGQTVGTVTCMFPDGTK